MKFRSYCSIIFLSVATFLYAAPADYGRPWDDPDYHSSPLSKIFIPICILVLIILAIGYIGSHKEEIGNMLKSGFSILCGGALIFGLIILPLLDRCDRTKSIESGGSAPTNTGVNPPNTSVSSNAPAIQSSQPINHAPQEGEVGYKTKTYRIDVCRSCHGTGKKTIDANWGRTTFDCPTCHGTGKERIAGNYK